MAELQNRILDYLCIAGPQRNATIQQAVLPEYQVTRMAVNVALWRMVKRGLLIRVRNGLYAATEQRDDARYATLIVAGALDKLFQDYGVLVESELCRRGWRRE